MRRVVVILGLLATVLPTIACGTNGSDGSATHKTEASTTGTAVASGALPEEGPIPAGEYETEGFEPAFSFRVGTGWQVFQISDAVILFREEDDMQLSFSRIEVVFDPSSPSEEIPKPAPESVDGWITWLREHPNLETTEPVPTTLGSVSGKRIDTVLSSIPRDYPEGCSVPCVPAYSTGEREGISDFVSGYRGRYIFIDVEGETVMVNVEAPEENFAEAITKAQQVLDTVEWEAES